MNAVDKMLARAQVGLAFLFAFGFLGILAALIFVPAIAKETSSLLTNMMTVLGTLLTLQMNYFFARQRPPALPDPPNGGSNVQTLNSPAAASAPVSPFRT